MKVKDIGNFDELLEDAEPSKDNLDVWLRKFKDPVDVRKVLMIKKLLYFYDYEIGTLFIYIRVKDDKFWREAISIIELDNYRVCWRKLIADRIKKARGYYQ